MCNIIEALHGGFRERGEWSQKVQGAGSMASKRPGSREQKKVIQGAGSRELWVLYPTKSHNSQYFPSRSLRSATLIQFPTPVRPSHLYKTRDFDSIPSADANRTFNEFREQLIEIVGSRETPKMV